MGLIGQIQVVAALGGIVHDIALALIKGPVGHQVWVVIANAAACDASRVLANALQRSPHTLQYRGSTQEGVLSYVRTSLQLSGMVMLCNMCLLFILMVF